jgi:DNA/RNA endonuclease G (NUC1)
MNTNHTIGPRKIAVPTGFWKVVVDPNRAEALAFILPQRNIAKGKLEPWQTDVRQIEDAAAIGLPLPEGIDRESKPRLWPVNLAAWNAKHKLACASKKKKKH